MAQRRQQAPAATRAAPAPGSSPSATTAIEKPRARHQIVRDRIERVVPYIGRLLPEKLGISPERFARVAINCIESDATGKLLQCTVPSLIRALLHAAEVGLEPGGAYSHCYLLPYFNPKARGENGETGALEAQFMIGVWGYVELARRNPRIKNVWSDVIFEQDHYKVTSGSGGRKIIHEPKWDLPADQRGAVLGAYACAELDDGTVSSEIMNIQELEQARRSSKVPDSPAWKNWPTEMYKRTAIKRAQKYWPKGGDNTLSRAIEIEEEPGRVSLPVQAALASVAPSEAEPRPRRQGAALDALAGALKPKGRERPGSAPPPPPVEDDDVPTLVEVHEALAFADEAWIGGDRIDFVAQWSPAQLRLALDWARAAVEAPPGAIPERPAFTVLDDGSDEREPGEEG